MSKIIFIYQAEANICHSAWGSLVQPPHRLLYIISQRLPGGPQALEGTDLKAKRHKEPSVAVTSSNP